MRSEHSRWLLYNWENDTHVVLIIDLVERERYYLVDIILSWPGIEVEVYYSYDKEYADASVRFKIYGLYYTIHDEKIADEVLDKIEIYLKNSRFIQELEFWIEGDSNA